MGFLESVLIIGNEESFSNAEIPGLHTLGYRNRNGARCQERSANAGDGCRIRDPDLRRMGGGGCSQT